MRSYLCLTAAGLLVLALAVSAARADVVYLKNGKKFEGAAEDRGDTVVLRLERGSFTFQKEDVDRIEKKPAPWDVYEQKARELKPGDAAGHLALAKWCRENSLGARAEKELAAVLQADPENAEAHALLGHQKFEGKWMTEVEALKARGFMQVEGIWLGPKEYEAYRQRKEAEEKNKALVEAEKQRILDLADKDKEKVAAARKYYTNLGTAKATPLLLWGVSQGLNEAARLEAYKLINELGVSSPTDSQFLAQRTTREDSGACLAEICRGIKARKDDAALTWLVYLAAVETPYRRRAAAALRLVNDTRAYRALIGCVAAQPKDTLPGVGGVSLSNFGSMGTTTTTPGPGGTMLQTRATMESGEVVPAADSLECISGRDYRNDIDQWLKWVGELERAPGGAVIEAGKGK